jgi:hypothetical protein
MREAEACSGRLDQPIRSGCARMRARYRPKAPTRFVWCLCYSCSGLARPRGESIRAIELPSPSAEQRPVSNAGNEARRLISCVKPVLQFGQGQLVFCMCYAVSRKHFSSETKAGLLARGRRDVTVATRQPVSERPSTNTLSALAMTVMQNQAYYRSSADEPYLDGLLSICHPPSIIGPRGFVIVRFCRRYQGRSFLQWIRRRCLSPSGAMGALFRTTTPQ